MKCLESLSSGNTAFFSQNCLEKFKIISLFNVADCNLDLDVK